MAWSDLGKIAPYTKSVFEELSKLSPSPVIDEIPKYLGIFDCRLDNNAWSIELERVDKVSGTSNRELLLRYLLTRAIVDQGSDIEGVEMWHSKLLEDCYVAGFRVLHEPSSFVQNYQKIIEFGAKARDHVVAARASIWASQKERGKRSINSYTPFNVDGFRGSKQTHWFISGRLFPALMLAVSYPGGLVKLCFEHMVSETPLEMSRRVRNDKVYGLGYCIGDKACDLFCKWAIGTYRLTVGVSAAWTPADSPIPMDQRIGRLMIRTGFMDEFFDVSRMMSKSSFGFTPKDNQSRPTGGSSPIPSGRWFLKVMDFRRKAKVQGSLPKEWLEQEWRASGATGKCPKFGPQEVVNILCKSMNRDLGTEITPVEIDDQFMRLGGNICTDDKPKCDQCSLKDWCQANTDSTRIILKSCYT